MKLKSFVLILVLVVVIALAISPLLFFYIFNNSEVTLEPEFIEELYIADLAVPSGKIITSDPFFAFDAEPFSKIVEPGSYPVSISIYKIEENHFRIGKASMKFSEDAVVKWELATTNAISKEEIESLDEDEYYGFPVDGGLGCFIDYETNKEYNRWVDEFESNFYDDVLEEQFKAFSGNHKYSTEYGDWTNLVVNKESGLNIVMFTSGWGDGFYPTYWGIGKDGKPKQLVIDFLLTD